MGGAESTIATVRDALLATTRKLEAWSREAGIDEPSSCNFVVTDGRHVVALRYATRDVRPPSLYVSSGERFGCVDGSYRMVATADRPAAVIIASEPLTTTRDDWTPVPRNHVVSVTMDLEIEVNPVP